MPVKVLVVENDPLLGEVVAAQLEECGFDPVGPFRSTVCALKAVKQRIVNAAVLDFDLGKEFVTPVVEKLIRRGIGFVIYSGYDYARIRRRMPWHFIYLHKPATFEQLLGAVNDSLRIGDSVSKLPLERRGKS